MPVPKQKIFDKMHNVGIIGTGRIGFLLEHDPLRIKPCTHAGGILKNKKRIGLFGKEYNIKHLYTDYKDLFKNEKIEIAVISTWTDSHKDITIEAAKKGAKIIVCEKPMAFTSKDCRAMINACKKYRNRLIINHERRYDPLYRKAKELISKNRIGKIRTVTANVLTSVSFRKKSFVMDNSSLLHDGTHLIDIALFLFGQPKKITGVIPKYRRDTTYGTIEFENGTMLFLEAGGDRKYFNFELDIQGTEGRMKIGNEYRQLWIRKKSPRYTGFHELEEQKFPKIPDRNHFIEEYKEVVNILEGKTKKPTSSGEDGLKTIEIIEKISNFSYFINGINKSFGAWKG